MKREDRLEETRRKLIDGTIQVIARQGLDGASTKLIGTTTELNEVYIYRSFKDKEDLFAKTFAFLDEELLDLAMKHIDVMYKQEMETQISGFKDMSYDICPYCGEVNHSSMEVEYTNYKI
jgi:AcrR family transcriptional regulator